MRFIKFRNIIKTITTVKKLSVINLLLIDALCLQSQRKPKESLDDWLLDYMSDLIIKCMINHNIMFGVLVFNLNVLIWNRIKKQ